MAISSTSKNVSSLVINKVPSPSVYKKMKDQNLINEDELYLVSSSEVNKYTFTATAGQTTFTIPFTFDVDASALTVYYNGVMMQDTENYTITDKVITLNGWTAEEGDYITVMGIEGAAAIDFAKDYDKYSQLLTTQTNEAVASVSSTGDNYKQELTSATTTAKSELNTIVSDGTTQVQELINTLPENWDNTIFKNQANTFASGGKITMASDYTPIDDNDLITKKYVSENSYKVGDTLTTVRTDLGDDWLLCNGAIYTDETSQLYKDLPDIPYNNEIIFESYPSLKIDDCTITRVIQYIDGYYFVYGTSGSGSSLTYNNFFVSDLLGNNAVKFPKYLSTDGASTLLYKYNNQYLFLDGNYIYTLSAIPNGTVSELLKINNSDFTNALSGNTNFFVFNNELLVLNGTSRWSTDFYQYYNETNNIFYTNGSAFEVNGQLFILKYREKSSLILDVYLYNKETHNANLLNSVNIGLASTSSYIDRSNIYFSYYNNKYYIYTLTSNILFLLSSSDGSNWDFVCSDTFTGITFYSDISGYLLCYITYTKNNVFSSGHNALIPFGDFTKKGIKEFYGAREFNSIIKIGDYSIISNSSTTNGIFTSYSFQIFANTGKILPKISDPLTYTYIKAK